ncbi:MAG: Clp protease N-terminal domain-containing protein [Planctomycetota bacterium]
MSLEPYARSLLRTAGTHALRLHAEAVSPEHLLWTLMEDPHSAAHAAVLHAFADPGTISEEVLAISPGLLVVASGSTLAFSVRAVEVLTRTRAAAEAAGEEAVSVSRLLSGSVAAFDESLQRTLQGAGFSAEIPREIEAVAIPGPGLFRHFSMPAKRVLSGANRLAASDRSPSISHVHLFLACLQEDEGLAASTGVNFRKARLLLSGSTRDDTAPSARSLPPDRSLIEFLEGLPGGSDSLALLARFHAGGTPELAQILVRSKVTTALLDRARKAFRDPDGLREDDPARR